MGSAGMEFKIHKLSNGLTIVGEVNKTAKSSAVGFFVKTGARDEDLKINGVSHFLEHMIFKGTDRLSALEVNEEFDRTGAVATNLILLCISAWKTARLRYRGRKKPSRILRVFF